MKGYFELNKKDCTACNNTVLKMDNHHAKSFIYYSVINLFNHHLCGENNEV